MTDNRKEREYLYYAVSDAMVEFYRAVRLIAKITLGRLSLARAAYAPELWVAGRQEILLRAFDLAQNDCLSQRESKIFALREAAQWLNNYGGSWQRRDRGLEMIEGQIKLLQQDPTKNIEETDNEYRA
ncbi:MAG: hypothetical protein KKC55_14790 [Gammaproteobacteria bacterium]|uniref:Uncharacterized protein n=1 Tax=viral metagenome TaxID=1070528 RepID=A0A6H1ZWQ1_9ZZZZ|nr:hypothetical protein [Gammaproteobacteria bacterium]